MPNRRVVTKSVAQPLFANKSNGPFTTWQTLPLYLTVQKQTKPHHIFRYAQTPTRKKATCRRQRCCLPFARRRNFMHFASHDRIFTIGFLLPSSASSRWFYSEILHNPTFLYKLSLNKIVINQQIKTQTKIIRYVVHIVMKKLYIVKSASIVLSVNCLLRNKAGSLTIAQRVGRWFPVIHFLFVTWRVPTVRCDFYCLFALYVGEFELCILKIPFQQSLSSIRP